MTETNLGLAFLVSVNLTTPDGHNVAVPAVSWVLDPDGTGCAVVMLPNGTCARVDRLTHDGWTVTGVEIPRPPSGLLVP